MGKVDDKREAAEQESGKLGREGDKEKIRDGKKHGKKTEVRY